MCGIAGWFGPIAGAAEATIHGMMERIAHRGPDGRGTATLPDQAGTFGHLRLAIIDPAGGQQPMWSPDGRSVLVLNGEIYNYKELRAQRPDVAWRTNSDTEVVLHLLQHEGPEALSRLRGMYALAFWHGTERYGLLARDPTGIKPLFVRTDTDTLWFASEAKAFPATAQWRPELDCGQLHLLLNLRYPAGGQGLMRGVEQIAPGHSMQWREQRASTRRIAPPRVEPIGSEDIHDAVIDSVRAHLVADVPVASYLSGGIDSGIVTFAASRLSPGRIATYTIDAGDDPREAANAAATASWLGVPNRQAKLAEAGHDALSWLLWHLEVPKINALQSAAVAQLAARHVRVCLSGLGGDELFYGYRAHRQFELATEATRMLGPLAPALGNFAARLMPRRIEFGEPWRAARMLAAGRDVRRVYALLRNVWEGSVARESIYGPRMLDQPLPSVDDWIAERWPQATSPVEAMGQFEWRNKMVDDLLWQEDRTSMAVGLEVRVPFVDEHLRLALAPHAPISARAAGQKRLLKQAFAQDLPTWLLQRPKSGFQLDIATQLDALFASVLEQWLSPESVRRHGLFAPAFVAHLRALPRRRAHRWHFFLLLLMAQAHRWIELFEAGNTSAPARPTLVLEDA